jgi:hypothetical protein
MRSESVRRRSADALSCIQLYRDPKGDTSEETHECKWTWNMIPKIVHNFLPLHYLRGHLSLDLETSSTLADQQFSEGTRLWVGPM